LKRYLLIFIFLISYIFAINIDIANKNLNFYTTLLKSLKDNNTTNKDELSLQKTLLKKIIDLSTLKLPDVNITKPSNQKEYKKLFDTFLKKAIDKNNFTNNLKNVQEKLKTLSQEIKDINNTNLTQKLFFTLYKKEQLSIEDSLKILENNINKIESYLLDSLHIITFNRAVIFKNINQIQNKIEKLKKQIEALKLKKERFELLAKDKEVQKIDKKIDKIKQDIDNLYKEKVEYLFLEFSLNLQRKSQNAFKIHKEIIQIVKSRLLESSLIVNDIDNLLSKMEKQVFGTVGTLKGKGVQEIKTQLENIWKFVNKPLFSINTTPVSIFKIIIALVIFIIGLFIGNFYKKQIAKLSLKNKTITSNTQTLLSNIGYYIIFIITFFIVLKVLGINLSSLALVAGALSVGIGFGLQNIVSNFVSGIILMVERSIKIGDYIQIDEDLRGRVTDIKMRSITINTNQNIDVIVPNQDLIQNHVINWTMNDRIRRFEIPFGVAYGTNPQKVIDVVLAAVKNSGYKDIFVSRKRFTRVVMTGMGDSSVNFELFVWVVGEETLYPKRTTSRFLILIYNALYENGIEIPFPQQDLHIRSISEPLPIILKEEKKDD
jgi:small-conductance mechanosensitive channel